MITIAVLFFLIGFFSGACLMFFDCKGKTKNNMIPYIANDGTLQWKNK